MSFSWSERIFNSLASRHGPGAQVSRGHPAPPFSLPRLRKAELRQHQQLLRRVLRSEPAYGFEAPPQLHQRHQHHQQSVLIAWPCPRGHLTPGGMRVALVANFVLSINRAFGNRVPDVVASVPPADAESALRCEQDEQRLLLVADIERLALRQCRVESEDCYARESHRLAKVLSNLNLVGSESWCDRRLGDLLAALARVERSDCHRLHWVAGQGEAARLSDLAAGLRHLGYSRLAEPAPWRLHVSVGPVVMTTGTPDRLEELLQCSDEGRDDLLLQLLTPPRALTATLSSEVVSTFNGLTAARLRRARQRLAESVSGDGGNGVEDDGIEDAASWTRREVALARHLAEFPGAAAAAYLSYEPRPLVTHLAGLVRLVEDGESDFLRRPSLLASAARRVFSSTCATLGLLLSAGTPAG